MSTLKDYIYEFSERNRTGADIPVYSVTNTRGFCKGFFDKDVASSDRSSYKIVPYGFFAYNPSRINVGSIAWQDKEERAIVSPLYVVFGIDEEQVRQDYLMYYLKSPAVNHRINALATGTVRMNLKLSVLGDFPFSAPSLEEQKKTVAELDLLSGIIEKQKAQLKELDDLAQSTFYDMFGDPDDSRYPLASLGQLAKGKLSYGSSSPSIKYDGEIRYIRITDIQDDGDLNNDKVSPCNYEQKDIVHEGDVLFARTGATVGKTYLCKSADNGSVYAGYLIRFVPNTSLINPVYVYYFTRTPYYKEFIRKNVVAVAQPNVNAQKYSSLNIPVPPLDLQQEFVDKVASIEKQKTALTQSIAESQKLLDYTMDKYFG